MTAIATDKQTIPTTTFRYGEQDIALWKRHSLKRLAYDIVNVNRKTIYTAVTMLGLPGWGKTTATQALIHNIHEIEPKFNVVWKFKEDILKVDKILDKLPKHQPVILVFDDVSWLLQQLHSDKKYEILNKLTTVREILDPEQKRTQVMLFMDYHYSFAVDKPFRQAPFSVQVSITNEERENYLKTIGHSMTNKRKILAFIKMLESAYKYDNFRVKAPRESAKRYYEYVTDAPFRPAMVFNMSQIHLTLFHPTSCQKCAPKKTYDKPDPAWLAQLVKAEGIDRVHRDFRFFTFMQTGKASLLHKKDARILRHINDEYRQRKIPLEEIEQVLQEVKQLPTEQQESQLVAKIAAIQGRDIDKVETLTKDEKEKVDAESVKIDQEKIDVGEEPEGDDDDNFDFEHSAAQVAGRMDEDDDTLAFDPLNQHKDMIGGEQE